MHADSETRELERPWRDRGLPTDERIRLLVDAITAQDQIALGIADFASVAHLGVPALVYTDGGNGVRDAEGTTAFPVTLALAAAFDSHLAFSYGAAIGSEVRSVGRNVLLGPAIDIARTPLAGRLPEAFGEDPWLAGELASGHVRGVQSHPVVCMVKHLVANNFETDRTGEGPPAHRREAVDVRVPSRALHQVYLEPFKKVLLGAGAWSVMGSYNRLNGVYPCQSPDLFDIVKRQWEWPGFVAPDFMFAVRDPLAAVLAGLDVPGLDGAAGRNAAMFAGGSVPEERLNDIVHRILRAMFASGLFDNPATASSGPASTAEHVAVAKQVAAAGTVLLTNSQGLLPLRTDAIRQIAVIGPAAHDAIYVIGGSGGMTVDPMRCSTPLRGIADRARAAITVVHAQGSLGDVRLPAVPGAAFAAPGVLAEYFVSGAAGVPEVTRTEGGIDCSGPPAGIDGEWSARWTGQLVPRLGGIHRLSLTFAGKAVLSLNGQELVRGAREAVRLLEGPELPLQAVVSLEAGVPVDLRVEYETGPALHAPELGLTPSIELGWQEPGGMMDEAVGLAASSDVAVVLVQQASGEGMDRSSLHLPGDQDELVHAIALANPNTVVVLNTPGPVLMPWLQEVAAVVQVWYPGQQFGAALAGVLFGDEDPGGRLPVTFPAAAEQGPPHRLMTTPGAGNTVHYDEDLLVGYGFFDSRDQEPLFAFGHGLSYGTYAYSDLAVQCEDAGRTVRIAATITNQGLRAGTEVVQLYAGWPPVAGQPPRQLRGIAKVVLAPGQQTVASCEMAIEDLATYWPRNASWIVHDGRYEVTVGRSSRDLRLCGSFSVAGGLLADG